MINSLIQWMNAFPPEVIWVATLVFCFLAILILLRWFGPGGLYVYIAVAIVGANIQVLKAVKFGIYSEPVALGTILFSTTYLCTDILNEYYSARQARKGVMLGFAASLLFTCFMLFGLGFQPIDVNGVGRDWAWAAENHGHMKALFIPAPAILLAGMTAYLCSQFHDIWIYNFLKKLTGGKFLWLRNNGSTLLSALIDNAIFSIMAWKILAEEALPWKVIIFTFILGTYGLRIAVALLDTPLIYLARFFLPEKDLPNISSSANCKEGAS